MELVSLEIERTESYATPANTLIGTVKLKGPLGEVSVKLSPGALSSIIGVVAAEVAKTARNNAKQVEKGMQNAADEPLLLEHASNIESLGKPE